MQFAPRHLALIATLVPVVALPAVALAGPADDEHGATLPAASVRAAHTCGTRQVRNPLARPVQRAAGGGPRTIFLNRMGGTYQIVNGATNSATMTAATFVTADDRPRTAVIPPLAADFPWPTISACVQQHYARYDVRFVENRPASGVYLEAVIGGDGTELGFGRDELFGVASADNFCGVTEAGIAFNFSETHRGVGRRDEELCATIAHELGHLLALEHETLAIDNMSYVFIEESGSKSLVYQASPCGVRPGQNQPCSCGGGSTNSAARLRMFVGARPMESVPPSLTVVSPDDGAERSPFFTVEADATDNMEMSRVSVLIDGAEAGADIEPVGDRYVIELGNVAEGERALTVRAEDRAGNKTDKTLTITVAKLGLGASCTGGEQCAGGQCVLDGDDQYCTQTCDPSADSCPDDWTCTSAGAFAVCAGGGDSGGCCDAGHRPGAGTGLLVLGIGLLLLRRRRTGTGSGVST